MVTGPLVGGVAEMEEVQGLPVLHGRPVHPCTDPLCLRAEISKMHFLFCRKGSSRPLGGWGGGSTGTQRGNLRLSLGLLMVYSSFWNLYCFLDLCLISVREEC